MAVIFVLTYAGVALGRIPGLRLDRAGIALTGAAMTMAVGALTPREAYQAIDLDTLALLLGMMIVKQYDLSLWWMLPFSAALVVVITAASLWINRGVPENVAAQWRGRLT